MNFEEFKSWLCSMCSPAIHRSEWIKYKEHNTTWQNLGSAEYVLNVDDENYVIKKQNRFQPNFENEEYVLDFNDHVLDRTNEVISRSFQLIVEPYSQDELKKLLDRWIKDVSLAYSSTLNDDYYRIFSDYGKALKNLLDELKRLKDRLIEVESGTNPPKPIDREWIRIKWKELKEEGHSDNATAKAIKEMLNGAISISTIKRYCIPGYNY